MRSVGAWRWALALATGCAGMRPQITLAKAAPRGARLIAVYPTALRFDAPAYRSFELSADAVDAVLATGRFMALGPDEFAQLDWPSNLLYASTNLSGKLTALGLSPPEVFGLRGWIERREQRGSQQHYDPKGRPTGNSRSAEVTYVVHEDLIGSDSDEPLEVGSLEIAVDPFADHPAWDDAPELRQALKTLVGEMLHRASAILETHPQVVEPPFPADWIPWNEQRFSMPGRPALESQLSALDLASAEAARLLRLAYFVPDLPPERQNRMLTLPPGLWVHASRAGLLDGDLITAVEGDAVCGPETLLRWASAKAPRSPVELTVLRGDQVMHLSIPAPDR
jgi:hypothetical protein